MGIPDSSLLDLIYKVDSSFSQKTSDTTSSNSEFEMGRNSRKTCSECNFDFSDTCREYNCSHCGRMLCAKCMLGYGSPEITAHPELDFICCKFCCEIKIRNERNRRFSDKIYPSDSPRLSPEPPSPCFSGERSDGYSPHAVSGSSVISYTGHPSPASARCSPIRSDEEEAEDSSRTFFSPSSEFYYDTSDVDSSSISARHNFHISTSVESSPDSPSRIRVSTDRYVNSVQKEPGGTPRAQKDGPADRIGLAVSRRLPRGCEDPVYADRCSDNLSIFRDQCEKVQKPLDFENNGFLWFPPPPNDEGDDMESNFFTYDDDDDEIGDSGFMFSSSSSLPSLFPSKEKSNEEHKEPLRAVIHGHFRALVSQLLQGEDIKFGKESSAEDWLEIITAIAWQAADFIRPDTSRGGSMDPVDYVKVKCVASGSPHESTFVKGVICTKNVKHKRMTSQYKNPRLLLLGGALEYQKVPNQLSSFQTLLQQEIDHLKLIVARIVAHRPNVLLVEKSVSSYAQEFLLEKEISLVLNVKRPVLECIARCTGALVTPSVDGISAARLGHCELFKLEKVSEDLEKANQFNKKPSKTLMFFEGCTRRLGCTVLLKGSSREELKKIKRVVQFAVFAAYHLSLETSFLADERASLPKITMKPLIPIPDKEAVEHPISVIPDSGSPVIHQVNVEEQFVTEKCADVEYGLAEQKLALEDLGSAEKNCATSLAECQLINIGDHAQQDLMETVADEVKDLRETETLSDKYSVTDGHPSLLVSFSSRCVLKGTVCELSRLLRITFYGCFDKPLGRYLRDDLFDQTSSCRSCNEPTDAHVLCFSHQKGNMTINVKRLPSVKLPGEQDGKIWMWHRCLKCPRVDGVPPASRRVVMSDAAWGLSFGKFLELSLLNNATANRVASCGHSLQKDCLRYYGFGCMVAFFRYSPIDILSVHLPPSVLDFSGYLQQEWIRKAAAELLRKTEALYAELLAILDSIEQRSIPPGHEYSDVCELHDHIIDLKDQLVQENRNYKDLLQPSGEYMAPNQTSVDILELNRLRRSLIISAYVWDRQFYSLDSLLKTRTVDSKSTNDAVSSTEMNGSSSDLCSQDSSIYHSLEEGTSDSKCQPKQKDELNLMPSDRIFSENPSLSLCQEYKLKGLKSDLSDKIDSAWTGTDLHPSVGPHVSMSETDNLAAIWHRSPMENPAFRRLRSPARVYSFDSALRLHGRVWKGLTPSLLQFSKLHSFHASGEYRSMVRDPVSNVQRSFSQVLPGEARKLNTLLNATPSFISSVSLLPEGARFPQTGRSDLVIAVYDNEPTSVISFALSLREYTNWIADRPSGQEGNLSGENSGASIYSTRQSFASLDLGFINNRSYGPEDALSTVNSLLVEPKNSPHVRITFEDESLIGGEKVKFSCTCYFAKQFEALRKKCCPTNVDFVRSLSRCKGWSAQGGKSNVYFAKSLDDRFIIKQVRKTELDSFVEFAPEYFKYLTESLSTKSPTSLAKILGIYQVTVKHLKGGKETKMDLMVMENLFFRRNILRVYDLKGSARSRYNADPSGTDKVLLDMNLLETLRTKPIFLGSKAKRSLERAVWNDTAFLASVDVMDYSLLVGVDEERNELVVGIIDYMRQYTWDKQLETWVKASGILGGPKNASPTIISPKQYKKRFRKAMTTYFLTVPDQWSS